MTDAVEILGIGDWGTNGVGISIGKLMVYTAAADLDPLRILPVVFDVGTDNQKLFDDTLYWGNRHKRVNGQDYYDFVDNFVRTAEKVFPNLYLHFEDFGCSHAANLLNKYINEFAVFNDDIEGTGIISLAGILGALKISEQKLTDQIYTCFGAGIAQRVYHEFVEQGLDEESAKKKFYLVDKQGLLFEDTPEQKFFCA